MSSTEKMWYDAVLEDWIIGNFYGRQAQFQAADGVIFGDKANRWPDGTQISTSKIIKRYTDSDGNQYIQTRNTVYRLGTYFFDNTQEETEE